MRKTSRLALTALLLGSLGLATLPPEGSAQTASLVREFEPGGSPRPQSLREWRTLGEGLFFALDSPETGNEVWYSDGTPNGTRMLADGCPDECGSFSAFVGSVRNVQLWISTSEDGGRLWRSDGTRAGTFPLTEPHVVQFYGSLVADTFPFFFGCTEEGCAIWKTDGTRAGTRPFAELNIVRSDLEWMRPIGDQVVFEVDDEIWTADARGARRLAVVPAALTRPLVVWNHRVFFIAETNSQQDLWVSDGTPRGTFQVTDFAAPRPFSSSQPVLIGQGGIYFLADDVIHGQEAWKSDGTVKGTRRITDFGYHLPFEYGGSPLWGTEIDGKLFFAATDGLSGHRLWKTSGTPESMVEVSGLSLQFGLYPAGDRVLFMHPGGKGCELWSFGAAGAGVLIEDSLNCNLTDLGPLSRNGKVYYGLTTYSSSGEPSSWLWRTDGSKAGTVRLSPLPGFTDFLEVTQSGRRIYMPRPGGDVWLWEQTGGLRQLTQTPDNGSTELGDFAAFDGRLFFSVNCWPGSLWQSAGTAETTSPVAGPLPSCGESQPPLAVGDSLYFVTPSQELWRLGRSGTPVRLTQALPGLTEFQGRVLFGHIDADRYEIWSSDGTTAGTRHAFDLPAGYQLEKMAVAGSFVYLFLQGSEDQDELWRSDGTTAGTSLVATLGSYGETRETIAVGSRLFFIYDSYASGPRLWKTDGTTAGTAPLLGGGGEPLILEPRNLIVAGGALYLFGIDGERAGFWKTDGTPAGTVLLASFPGADGYRVPRIPSAEMNGRLFFVEDDGEHGSELWATDGTPAGTRMVADIVPGSGSSYPRELTAAGNRLFFTAHDRVHGRELWLSDGTAAGTRLVQDIAPEARSSAPEHLTVAGNRLYFSADDDLLGRELWSLPLTGPSACRPSSTRLCLNGGRFQADVRWRDFQGGTGSGRAVPLTGDTGYFWFFDPANAEVILKVLDGRGLNDHFWVFYGALSSVEYTLTVTDTQTGLARRYRNPSGQLASVGDTTGFGPQGAFSAWPEPLVAPPSLPALVSARTEPAAATGSCQPGPRRLCLNGGRFAAEVSWKDFEGKTGKGTAVPLTADTGYFWFFDAANIEVMLKVLDGTPLNGKFWVFYGALSNVEYELTVTDTHTGAVKQYRNPSGRFASVADTGAF